MAQMTMAEALNAGLGEEMARDDRVFLIGQDMKRGVFAVSKDLRDKYGEDRVINAPLSESVIAGSCVGAAMMGQRPVGEIMFGDFMALAMDQIVNSAAKVRYCHGGKSSAPLVIRTASGGIGKGIGPHHNQSFEAMFAHVPGLVVVMASSPASAKGLIKSSIRCDDPVVFFEPKALYRIKDEVPEEEYLIPLGKCAIKREGTDATVVATGAIVKKALAAAETLGSDGINVEVIDPQTLKPLDKSTILESVKKTGRLVITEEACKTGSFGAQIAAIVAEEGFSDLRAPVKRVAAPDTPIPASAYLEGVYLPDPDQIVAAVKAVVEA